MGLSNTRKHVDIFKEQESSSLLAGFVTPPSMGA